MVHGLTFYFQIYFILFYSISSWIGPFTLYKMSKDKHRMVKDKNYRNERLFAKGKHSYVNTVAFFKQLWTCHEEERKRLFHLRMQNPLEWWRRWYEHNYSEILYYQSTLRYLDLQNYFLVGDLCGCFLKLCFF